MKTIQMSIAFLFLCTITFAQGRQGRPARQEKSPEEQAKNRTEMLATKIGLTEDQKAKVYEAKLQRIIATKEAKKTSPPNQELMKAANMKYSETMKTILTPEQMEKVKAMAKEWKNKRGDKNPRKGTPPATNTPSPIASPNGAPSDEMDEEPMF